MSGSRANVNSVFYAESYHPIQAGSIDGTDVLPHDSAVYRAHLCSQAGLYDALGDPKVIGDPYCTVFVGRLSHLTTEESLLKAMNKYGKVKNLRLVRHIVTGASRGYAFVEFETEREMRRAYENAHHSFIDDSEVIVDYNRQQLMPGWIPRRLGGGLGGKKESGQLRFGGRERPFRAPLRPIPFDELKRLGIPPPPEGRYMSRFQVPSPPRRRKTSDDTEERYRRPHGDEKHHRDERRRSRSRDESSFDQSERRGSRSQNRSSVDQHERKRSRSRDHSSLYQSERRTSRSQDRHERKRSRSRENSSRDRTKRRRSRSRDRSSVDRYERSIRHPSVDYYG